MRLVVTGRAGQVARSLAALGSPGLDVVTAARPELDLSRPETVGAALKALRPFDAIVSAAAYTAVDRAESEPELAFRVNRDGAAAVADAAAAAGVPVLHLSTDYVYAGDKPAPYVETDPAGPLNVYGASKLAGELAVAAVNPRAIVLRTSWVYAPFGANFVRTVLRLASERPVLKVVADQTGCPNFAPDLAAAIVSIARKAVDGWRPGMAGAFHLSSTEAMSWHGFAERIIAVSGRHGGPSVGVEAITSAEFPQVARRPANSRLDAGKAAAVFGMAVRDASAALEECVPALLREMGQGR